MPSHCDIVCSPMKVTMTATAAAKATSEMTVASHRGIDLASTLTSGMSHAATRRAKKSARIRVCSGVMSRSSPHRTTPMAARRQA